jgi:hypothetical protein
MQRTPSPEAPKTGPLKTSRFKVPGEGSSVAISVVTVVVLVLLWALVTAPRLIKPLFLPSPQAVFQQFHEYLTGAANDKPLWQHFVASILRVAVAFWAGLPDRGAGGHRDGHEPRRARHLRPADRVLPPAAAAGLPAADHHLVRHRRAAQGAADLPGLLRAAGAGRALGHEERQRRSRSTPRTRWAPPTAR